MSFFISSSEMLKLLVCFLPFFLSIGLTNAGQEQVIVLNLLTNPTAVVLQEISHTNVPLAVSVDNVYLGEISSSVLKAESWVRTHVLAYFPATPITTIVVATNVLCNNNHEDKWGFVLPSVKNIYHSLKRWGLEKEIKVSPVFSAECLHPFSYTFREDLAHTVIKPLLGFLQSVNSTYSVNAPPDFSPLVSAYEECVKKFGVLNLSGVNVVMLSSNEERKPKIRKLYVDPFPASPTPLPEPANSIGFSVPSHEANNPLPPLAQTAPPPSYDFSFAPQSPPLVIPSNPPEVSNLPYFSSPPYVANPPEAYVANPPDASMDPPCYRPPSVSPTLPTPPRPGTGGQKGLWCVAKPTVPEVKLQEAMDYACGVGGGDCDEIKPSGNCYYPNTVLAHASYAFNSYWQKNKNNGGTCDFEGTAMVINGDPSFQHCKFILIT